MILLIVWLYQKQYIFLMLSLTSTRTSLRLRRPTLPRSLFLSLTSVTMMPRECFPWPYSHSSCLWKLCGNNSQVVVPHSSIPCLCGSRVTLTIRNPGNKGEHTPRVSSVPHLVCRALSWTQFSLCAQLLSPTESAASPHMKLSAKIGKEMPSRRVVTSNFVQSKNRRRIRGVKESVFFTV